MPPIKPQTQILSIITRTFSNAGLSPRNIQVPENTKASPSPIGWERAGVRAFSNLEPSSQNPKLHLWQIPLGICSASPPGENPTAVEWELSSTDAPRALPSPKRTFNPISTAVAPANP